MAYADLAEKIGNHLGNNEIVQVTDSNWPAGDVSATRSNGQEVRGTSLMAAVVR